MNKAKVAVSSGGVTYKEKNKNIEVALIAWDKEEASRKKRIWCLPKGLVEKSESLKDAALREVREETGISAEVVEKLGQIDYWFYSKDDNARCHKFVHFFLLHYKKGSLKGHDCEVEKAKWFPIDEAISILSYLSEAEIVKKAKEKLIER